MIREAEKVFILTVRIDEGSQALDHLRFRLQAWISGVTLEGHGRTNIFFVLNDT